MSDPYQNDSTEVRVEEAKLDSTQVAESSEAKPEQKSNGKANGASKEVSNGKSAATSKDASVKAKSSDESSVSESESEDKKVDAVKAESSNNDSKDESNKDESSPVPGSDKLKGEGKAETVSVEASKDAKPEEAKETKSEDSKDGKVTKDSSAEAETKEAGADSKDAKPSEAKSSEEKTAVAKSSDESSKDDSDVEAKDAGEKDEKPKELDVKLVKIQKKTPSKGTEINEEELREVAQREKVDRLLKSSWTGMVERLRGFWNWFAQKFFDELVFPETRVKQIQEASEQGTVVYVLRSRSYLNFLIYNALFIVFKLPLVRFAPGLYWVPWQSWAQKLRVFRGWFGRLFGQGGDSPSALFEKLVENEVPTLIFLEKPVTLMTYLRRAIYWSRDMVRWIFRRPEAPGGRSIDLLESLVALQRKQEAPIFVCPQIMVWDRAPTSARKSFWDVMFGEKESPGLMRELYQFIRNKKRSHVNGGEPINLKNLVNRYTDQLSDAEVARKLRAFIKERFDKEFRVATGPVFRPASEMKDRVLRAPRVRKAIRMQAEESNLPEEVVQERARKILDRMAANFTMSTARKFDWFLNKIWKRMYTSYETDSRGMEGIEVLPSEIEQVRKAAMEHPLVLLPCHKSHVDYLIMSQILMHYDMVPPHIAAGDNLIIPVVGWIFRKSGAFFLRRSFGKDELYRTIFNEYVLRLLREGCTLEFFIEGGRSRTGKLRSPKTGMLKLLVDAALEKRIRDFYLVPTSVGYDRIVEGESYTRELLGGKKKRESLGGLLRSARKFMSINFGRIVVRFAEPLSIRGAIDDLIEDEKSHNADFDPVKNLDDRRQLVHILAYRVLYEINNASWVMPASLVVAVMMTEMRRGINHDRLVEEVDWLRREVEARGAKVYNFHDPDAVVRRATHSLSRLIKAREYMGKDVVVYRPRASRRLELAYYRNHLVHLFVSEAVIACALQAFQWRRASDEGVKLDALLKEVSFLSLLLKLEFIYKPSPDIQDNFDQTLADMERRGILSVDDQSNRVEAQGGEGRKMLVFLRHLFWPFCDSYWTACLTLFTVLKEGFVEEKAFIRKMQDLTEALYHEGYLRYSDAVSMDTLKNAISLFEELDMIVRVPMDEGGRASRKRQIELTEKYRDADKLREFVYRAGKFSSCREATDVADQMITKMMQEK